jgi:DNA/RNA-binding domain of Phe-tRNA-synthetase-like protein
MHFKVEQEIFEKLPNACFGVVVAKGIDNTKSPDL